jgi:putative serine protease PepD
MTGLLKGTAGIVAALAAATALGAAVGAGTVVLLDDDSSPSSAAATTEESTAPASTEPSSQTSESSFADVYSSSVQSVVEITASGLASDFGGQGEQRAQGSGFVYDDAGTIVTNQHVVDGASSISIRFWNGTRHRAELLGTDPSTDLAALKVDAPASLLVPLGLGDSSGLRVGDEVLALGSPFGLEGTLTSGIVSALHRQMTAPNDFTIADSIQTDAAINHGNSGGPLLDTTGRVVGVNAQIESESGGNDGVGFAIPSNTVRSVVSQLLETGSVEHAYLGVEMVDVEGGVAIADVKSGTPAEDAGLEGATGMRTVDGLQVPTGGDVIVAIDGKPVSTTNEVQSAIDARRPGDEVRITVLRDGDRRTLAVTLGTRPS